MEALPLSVDTSLDVSSFLHCIFDESCEAETPITPCNQLLTYRHQGVNGQECVPMGVYRGGVPLAPPSFFLLEEQSMSPASSKCFSETSEENEEASDYEDDFAGSSSSSSSSSSFSSSSPSTPSITIDSHSRKIAPMESLSTPVTGSKRARSSSSCSSDAGISSTMSPKKHAPAKSTKTKRIIRGSWAPAEDALLRSVVAEYAGATVSWTSVSARMNGRSAKQCRERWTLNLDPKINHDPFTPEDDAILLAAHAQFGPRWAKIKTLLPGRTENSTKTRFKSLMRIVAKKNEEQTASSSSSSP